MMVDHEIIICTHNRKKLLSRTLESLNQSRLIENWNILVTIIVNACNDGTESFLNSYKLNQARQNSLPLRWVLEKKPGKSNALNTALKIIQAPIVSMIDDDHRVPIDYFQNIKMIFESYPDIDFFCGKILPDWTGDEPSWVHDEGQYKIYPLPIPKFDLGDTSIKLFSGGAVPGGGNLVVKRKTFDRVGEFSTNLGPHGHNLEGSEDYDWVTRALSTGLKLLYHPDIIQYHYVDLKRVKIKYLMKKSLLRSKTVTMLKSAGKQKAIPGYIYKKIMIYLLNLMINFPFSNKRRFYLIRLSASVGEFLGFIKVLNLKG